MPSVTLPDQVTLALIAAHNVLRDCQHGWHVFGSCALALYGIRGIEVRDIDILIDEKDARLLSQHSEISDESGGGTELFRSTYFFRLKHQATDIEIMADMKVRTGDRWDAFQFATTQSICAAGRDFTVPALDELKQSLRRFGRTKDLARLKLIEEQT